MQGQAILVERRLGEVDALLRGSGITDLYGWWNGPQPALDGRTPAEAWVVGEHGAVAALVGDARQGLDPQLGSTISPSQGGAASTRRVAFLAHAFPPAAAAS
jgi:hypothetical protein